MNLAEISEYRVALMTAFASNQRIKDLLTNTDNSADTPASLINKHIFPHQYIPKTITKKYAYITMEINVPRVTNRTFKEVGINIFVYCEDDICACNNPATEKLGLRYDMLANEVDKIVNGSMALGFKAELESVSPYFPADNHHGLRLYYVTTEWNR